MEAGDSEFDAAVHAHDAALAARGCQIWVGAEPTFTDAHSEAPEWLTDALGGDKQERAQRLIGRLRAARPGAIVLRTLGRQYPGESLPRWSLGLYERRDGAPLWCGPPDPLAGAAACDLQHVQAFRAALAKALAAHGGSAVPFEVDDELGLRLVFRFDGQPVIDQMWYWSENHILLFRVNEYLAGQRHPGRTFSVTGMSEATHP